MKLVSGGTDLLFEQYSIKQIHEIEQTIRADIEKKKEDLRQMVGERYRDLIEAADTIGVMQRTSANVKRYVAQLTEQCQSLQGKPSTPVAARPEHWALSHHYTVLAQVKLLVDLPSKLWGEAERECWGRAACLQRLGQHVLWHLQLATGLEPWKALVSRQGTSLASLGHCLLQGCWRRLLSLEAPVSWEAQLESLTGLALLQGSSLTELLTQLLERRLGLVDQLVGSDSVSMREQLCGLATLLVSTLQLVQAAFLTSQPSALESRISEVTKSSACADLVSFSESPSFRYAPAPVRAFHVQVNLDPPILEVLQKECGQFVKNVEEKSVEPVVFHLSQLHSLQGLARLGADLRERLPKEEAELGTLVLGEQLSLWNQFFSVHVGNRITELIRLQLNAAMDSCLQALEAVKAGARGSVLEQPCEDFTWRTVSQEHLNTHPSFQEVLVLQTRGLTPQVQALCKSLCQHLECLLEELRPWGSVEEDLEQATVAMLGRWHSFVDSEMAHSSDADWLALLGQVCQGLAELCPELHLCFPAKRGAQDPWQREQVSLRTLRDSAYKSCFTLVVQQQAASLGEQLNTLDHFLSAMLCWGEVQVQEESEGGHQVQSTLRVPLQVTVPLQELLFALCQQVNRLFGHCMPKGIQSEVGQLLTSCLEPAYIRSCQAIVTQQLPPALCQTWALQLLMDLHVLNLLFQGGMLSTARATVEAQVDPFDLDVLMPHLGRQASLAAQQTSLLLGLCLGDGGAGRCLVSGPSSNRAPPTSPLVLPVLAAGSPRFPLLPTLSRFLDESPLATQGSAASGPDGSSSLATPSPPPKSSSGPDLAVAATSLTASQSTPTFSALPSFYEKMATSMRSSWFGPM
ncbi:conserved oligomeric Golgi complex subunit 1 isoform X1 [Rhipicephalus sanguineus]|uniref:conserved oligomeric Golgi complex subunit 1 isoform X1 n=1 Tax=Rhipicephalus sanguineus TaxID=34632 RepID=UPI00189349CC|nr:conserved oligomeric Golgi complex subunit 1 isoform X1 [Rhipicephalus sanguineus]